MANEHEVVIYFESKITERHLDKIIDNLYNLIQKHENKKYIFDFNDVEMDFQSPIFTQQTIKWLDRTETYNSWETTISS